jgi:hypothetical protein
MGAVAWVFSKTQANFFLSYILSEEIALITPPEIALNLGSILSATQTTA